MSRLRELRRARPRTEGINVAPLLDMIFILLIFFMVTTTFVKEQKLDLERPGAASGEAVDTRAIRVALDARGDTWLEGQSVSPWMLQSRVRELLAGDQARPVLVVSDRHNDVERLIEVVDQCRLAGARSVGIDVERTR